MATRPADVVDPFDRFVGRLLDVIEVLHLVHRPGRPALLGATAVRHQHLDRVVQLPHRSKTVDKPADLIVGVIQERCKRLLQSSGETLLVVR